MTRDVVLTVGLLLAAGLAARVLADLLRLPEIVLLIAIGALLGPSALDVVDVPLDSLGAQLLFTFGVSSILFYGGLNLSISVLREVAVSLGLLAIPGVLLTALLTGAVAALAFGLPFEQGLLIGAVLSPTDPAILIPLFVASRVRLKVAQTVIAESAFNDPTGAVLALGDRGRAAQRRGRRRRAGVGVPRRAGDQHGGRDPGRRAAVRHDLQPSGRHPARLGADRRARRRRDQLRLARLRGRERLPRRVPRRPDRRQHGAARAGDALRTTRRS